MSTSNNILIAICIISMIFGCKDDPPVESMEPCNPYCDDLDLMNCVEGQCLCQESMFYTPWLYNNDLCHGLTDSFYVRVGHEGNIEYFKPMDVLRMPAKSSLKVNSRVSISKDYPEQFILEWFTSRADSVNYDRYHPAHIVLVFDNDNPDNDAFPITGKSQLDPSDYAPQDYVSSNGPNHYYGVNFIWEVEYTSDSAVLHVEVYSSGDGSVYLEDEMTMYFERYRE